MTGSQDKHIDSTIAASLRVERAGRGFLGHDRVELLAAIHSTGSISAAARSVKMSYKTAWQAVDTMNNLADEPLVERSIGGRHGGGTRLTEAGLRTIDMFRQVEDAYQRFLARLGEGINDFERFNQLMRRFSMKTSARNQFLGQITRVTKGAVNGEVTLDIGNDQKIVAIITNESIEELKLEAGGEAYALIKASAPILVAETDALKTSARNRLCGRIVTCTEGAVNGEVDLQLNGGKRLTAIITNASIRSLGLQPGIRVCALVKASHVILAVHD